MQKNVHDIRRCICKRIYKEYQEFKISLISKSPEDIFAESYRIEVYINLFEILIELMESFSNIELRALLNMPCIMEYFYHEWLGIEDSFVEEMQESIVSALKKCQIKRRHVIKFELRRENAYGR